MLLTAFISYGGPDESFAMLLNQALNEGGIETFFFKQHAKVGEKLHHVMRDGVNNYDKVIFICSQNSLTRPGVLNELEETLQREAREGGKEILIPISIDNYVFTDWHPAKSGLRQTILDRVVGDFQNTVDNRKKFDESCSKLISALGGDFDFKYIRFHSNIYLDEYGKRCKIEMERTFITLRPVSEIIYTNLHCRGGIEPLSTSFGKMVITDVGGIKTIQVLLENPLPLNTPITHTLTIEHINGYITDKESYSVTALSDCEESSLDIYYPPTRTVKTASFKRLYKNKMLLLNDNMEIKADNSLVRVVVKKPIRGSTHIVDWEW